VTGDDMDMRCGRMRQILMERAVVGDGTCVVVCSFVRGTTLTQFCPNALVSAQCVSSNPSNA
jgi:hypothetical protein